MKGTWRKNQQGFTLVELMLVVAIISLMAGMATLIFEQGQASQQLYQAAWQLASDIRWMQQQSTDDSSTRLAELSPNPASLAAGGTGYRFRMSIWSFNSGGNNPNSYEVLDSLQNNPIEGPVYFSTYNVKATILDWPQGDGTALTTNITFYSFDMDMTVNSTLANGPYQIKLTNNTGQSLYVDVGSRVGLVWITPNATPPT